MTIAEIFYYSATVASWLFIILFILILIQLILVRKKIKELRLRMVSWKGVLEIVRGNFVAKALELVKKFVTSKLKEEVNDEKRK